MILTIEDLLNPFGKGTSTYQKSIVLKQFEAEYYAIKDRILYGLTTHKNTFIMHLKIPSMSKDIENIFYDTVFEFVPVSNSNVETTLNRYTINVYSNDPSFMFTYTYVFDKNSLLIKWLRGKCSHLALTKPPSKSNPQMIVGTCKSMWFAMFHVKRLGLNHKSLFEKMINTTQSKIIKSVLSQPDMLNARNKAKDMVKLAEKSYHKDKNLEHDGYILKRKIDKTIATHNASGGKHIPPYLSRRVAKAAVQARAARQARQPKRPR